MTQIHIEVKGPFFDRGLSALDGAIRDTIRELVAEGETDVKVQLYPGHGLRTGHYRRSIHGEVLNSRNGTVHDSNVIYGSWLEGVSSRNQRTRFKGYGMFRKAVQGLERKAKDIFVKHIARAIKGIN